MTTYHTSSLYCLQQSTKKSLEHWAACWLLWDELDRLLMIFNLNEDKAEYLKCLYWIHSYYPVKASGFMGKTTGSVLRLVGGVTIWMISSRYTLSPVITLHHHLNISAYLSLVANHCLSTDGCCSTAFPNHCAAPQKYAMRNHQVCHGRLSNFTRWVF